MAYVLECPGCQIHHAAGFDPSDVYFNPFHVYYPPQHLPMQDPPNVLVAPSHHRTSGTGYKIPNDRGYRGIRRETVPLRARSTVDDQANGQRRWHYFNGTWIPESNSTSIPTSSTNPPRVFVPGSRRGIHHQADSGHGSSSNASDKQ
ncbi:hypothetical protein OIV83_001197 [Microbotryomycetes sp. JL201]|nr:hypothetical protein OIV83_001197 [Microbotryomycetes sp. JL201]